MSDLRRREWAARTPEEKERHLASFIAAGQRHNKKNSKTRIETAVRQLLEELGADYQQNAQIGRFNVDFLVGTLVIECFGDFWHCNPAIWEPDDYNGSLHMRAGGKWAKDARRRQRLEEMGYRFHAFWESEIRDDRDTVRRVLAGIIGERS